MTRALRIKAVADALGVSDQYLYDHLDRQREVIDFGNGRLLKVMHLARWVVPAVELARFLGEGEQVAS